MKKETKIVIGIIAAIVIVFPVLWAVFKNIDTDNREKEIRNSITAKVKDQEISFDNMSKIIIQKAGVTKEYSKTFKEILPSMTTGRYANDQQVMMKWITENNPKFDVSLYQDLMDAIEVERNSFLTVQRQLVDLKREHDNLLTMFPSSWFINDGVKPIDIKLVSSTKAKKALSTGIDDDVKLFD